MSVDTPVKITCVQCKVEFDGVLQRSDNGYGLIKAEAVRNGQRLMMVKEESAKWICFACHELNRVAAEKLRGPDPIVHGAPSLTPHFDDAAGEMAPVPSVHQEARSWDNDAMDSCFAVSIKFTWLSRLGRRLFPPNYCPLPDVNQHGEYKDVLTNIVTVEMDWKDRLRVLLSGRIRTESKVITQNIIGKISVGTAFSTLPPKFMEPKENR